MNPYDLLPYAETILPETHPWKLETIARLVGHPFKLSPNARVVELGCGLGKSLLALSSYFPQIPFEGIDYSQTQIDAATKEAVALGLTNVIFTHADLMDFSLPPESVDIILCHGVYSWVPEPIKDKILALCAESLTPHGIAFVSYNTKPGWNNRTIVRDIMRFEQDRGTAPLDQVKSCRSFLNEIVTSSAVFPGPYHSLIAHEAERVANAGNSYFFHDYLEQQNDAFYFSEFMNHAETHGLSYIGDARPWTTDLRMLLRTEQQQTFFAPYPPARQQQMLDFIVGRMFRRSILSKTPSPSYGACTLTRSHRLFIAIHPSASLELLSKVRNQSPSGKLVVDYLEQRTPTTPALAEVLDLLKKDGDENATQLLLFLYFQRIIDLYPLPIPTALADTPFAPALVRRQAALGEAVTDFWLSPIALDDSAKRLLQLLDGTRTHADLFIEAEFLEPKEIEVVLQFLLREGFLVRG